jgi:putative acetyltransferase
MIGEIEYRESLPSDIAAIEEFYPGVFPDEDLLPLVRELLGEKSIVLSLVGIADQALVGHIVFTMCGIAGRSDKVALLGPLAVASNWQRRGIGTALIQDGLKRLKSAGIVQIHVLGDLAYYGRVGFEPDDRVSPPYTLPEEWRGAWQSIRLGGGEAPLNGELLVPQPWQQQALWTA